MDEKKQVRGGAHATLCAIDQERAMLASELHDGLGQTLVSVHLLASMGARLAEGRTDAADPLRSQLERINELSFEATERVRGLSRNFAPAIGRDLAEMLRNLADDLRMRHQLTTSAALPQEPFPPLSPPWLRQVYLAVCDVVRHLLQHFPVQSLDLYADRERDRIEIVLSAASESRHDGQPLPDGHALQLASYRANLLGGTLRQSGAGRRHRITLSLAMP